MKKEKIYRVFSHLPELATERLTLRKMIVADASDMYEYASRPDVTKYLMWNPHPDRDFTREYLEYLGNRYSAGMFYDWAVVYEPDCKMIGTCGFTAFDVDNNSAEIGYVLNSKYWGLGIGYEAASKVLEFGFNVLELNRIEVHYMVGNDASAALSKKLGMSFEGIHRGAVKCKGEYRDVCIAAITRDEYFR